MPVLPAITGVTIKYALRQVKRGWQQVVAAAEIKSLLFT
jgi:hypothetical protein